ncbi:hypothetical protein K435DRAFT_658133 [Dendrothele bispora CBS 962.96]|uniref:WD40 repeat-like protein n=1 Tax=Dendrothele bispora (strain CBS 962.96) TaxID=1314807 RepID=A0A4S8MBJ0_DENBC|nr:hypothetical protein K435DRAFT_705896 [Dendrothele bispora CBS 962.96]THU76152.1 hypothetical protein K435DRAFT_705463 [Dendrothele bispora CBS 962.96]THU99864.1 hypothetical protein K435DRAFT_658133 [Dendrothele bispora CBS 962.96]
MFNLDFRRLFKKSPYKFLTTLRGPRDTILSVSFSVEGRFLVAAGYSGVYLWDLLTRAPVSTPFIPPCSNDPKNMFCCTAWLLFDKGDRNVVIIGGMTGNLILWEWNHHQQTFESFCPPPATESVEQIMSIGVLRHRVSERGVGRIVSSHADRRVTVWSLSPTEKQMTKIFSVVLDEEHVPKTVRFSRESRDVLVFSLSGGGILTLHHNTGDIISSDRCGERADIMGNVSVDQLKDCFIAWTGRDFDIFTLSNLRHRLTLDGGVPVVSFAKQIVFADDGRFAVGGTDRGCAVLYDTQSGSVVQNFNYPKGGLVQPVTYCPAPEADLIAIAGSADHQANEILVFYKTRSATAAPPPPQTSHPAPSSSLGLSPNDSFAIAKLSVLKSIGKIGLCIVALSGIHGLLFDGPAPKVCGRTYDDMPCTHWSF